MWIKFKSSVYKIEEKLFGKICMYWVIDKAKIFHVGTRNNANSLLKYNTIIWLI